MNIEQLKKVFEEAKKENRAISVEVTIPGQEATEIISNMPTSIDSKLAYYQKTYHEDNGKLIHNNCADIEIVDVFKNICIDEEPRKVFLSQPMKGKTTEEINQEREEFLVKLAELIGDDFEIMDTVFEDFDGATPLKYLAKSIMVLAEADIAVFMHGWEEARGCVIEHECAVRYGIPALRL